MFGMALRSYLRKIQRLGESVTDRGRPLSQAVLDYLKDGCVVTRVEILQRFHRDDEAVVRAVLHDLCETGLVFRSGTGDSAVYRGATESELERIRRAGGRIDELLWVIVYRNGPLDRDALVTRVGGDGEELDAALERLTRAGRVQREAPDGRPRYSAREFYIPLGSPVGWEASVFDHFQAMVQTVCARLSVDGEQSEATPGQTGGSTYTLDVWPGHPFEEEARATLTRVRTALGELRSRIEAHNAARGVPATHDKVIFYCGQSVSTDDDGAAARDDESGRQ
jgi:hypothetical protein